MRRVLTKGAVISLFAAASLLLSTNGWAGRGARAATVESDGGITLVVSYSDTGDPSLGTFADPVTEIIGVDGLASCTPTNDRRLESDAGVSPGTCPPPEVDAGSSPCTAGQKLEGDLELLAEYIYQSTHGKHYLKEVYVVGLGTLWGIADVKWDMRGGPSYLSTTSLPGTYSGEGHGWINLRGATRTCIHEVLHHEIGHYLYGLWHRYEGQAPLSACTTTYPKRTIKVNVVEGDPNTFMTDNYPHQFNDSGNAKIGVKVITVDPTTGDPNLASSETMDEAGLTNAGVWSGSTLELGPSDDYLRTWNRPAALECGEALGLDEWSRIGMKHSDLLFNVHTPGNFPDITLPDEKRPEIHFAPTPAQAPGLILLVDASKWMQPVFAHLQEASLFLYHSARTTDRIGTLFYGNEAQTLYDYQPFDAADSVVVGDFPRLILPVTEGNLPAALGTAIDKLEAAHPDPGTAAVVVLAKSTATSNDLATEAERAANLGIRIHAMTHQDPASIAFANLTASSLGSIDYVGQEPEEMKRDVMRNLGVMRGDTRIFEDSGLVSTIPTSSTENDDPALGSRQIWKSGESLTGVFEVPAGSRDLLFYVFLKDGNAGQLFEIELGHGDPPGTVMTVSDTTTTSKQGRFIGTGRVGLTPLEWGTWRFKITPKGGNLPSGSDDLLVIAEVRNHEIEARAWLESVRVPHSQTPRRVVSASLSYRYPLTSIQAFAHVSRSSVRKVYEMMDDHRIPGGAPPDDGVYSTPTDFFQRLAQDFGPGDEDLHVNVEFVVTKQALPAPNVAYEAGTRYNALTKDYAPISGAGFSVHTSLVTRVDMRGARPTRPSLGPRSLPSMRQGATGTFKIRIRDAHPLLRYIRPSMGPGVTVTPLAIEAYRAGGSVLTLRYEVSKLAEPGRRDLRVQFGDELLRRQRFTRVIKS